MTLDQLLDLSREAEPMDDGFVRLVMEDVHADVRRRSRMKLVRRPVVFGIAAAVLATSGAVAALVGTYTTPKPSVAASSSPGIARVVVSAAPSHPAPAALPSASAIAPSASAASNTAKKGHFGISSLHTAWVIDDATGLKLTTETYKNSFTTAKAQRVTLTLLNTGSSPIVVSGLNSCALEVGATPAHGDAMKPACASGGVSNGSVLLAPGGFYTAVADVALPTSGTWNIVGSCTCAYSAPTQSLTKKDNPLGGVLNKAAPSELLPAKKDSPSAGTAKLSTPAIGVTASK